MTLRTLQFFTLMAVFAVLGLMPSPDLGGIGRGDLLAHLGGWIVGAISSRLAYPRAKWILLAAALWSYSFTIELAQLAAPTRSFELLDLVANAAGILVGLGIWQVVMRGKSD